MRLLTLKDTARIPVLGPNNWIINDNDWIGIVGWRSVGLEKWIESKNADGLQEMNSWVVFLESALAVETEILCRSM